MTHREDKKEDKRGNKRKNAPDIIHEDEMKKASTKGVNKGEK